MALELSTADVYEQASMIGQDIEKIIEHFGHEAVLDLMPKVVRVLEELELLVNEREKDKLEIAELRMENERLYLEIKKEANLRRKLDEELYSFQSAGEASNLKTMLDKLKEENKRLRLEFQAAMNEKPVTTFVSAPGDAEVMRKMKETIDSQRDAIRERNAEIDNQRADLDAMEEQIDRLTNINESLRRNLSAKQTRVRMLAKEKAELQADFKVFKLDLNKDGSRVIAEGEDRVNEELEDNEVDEDGNLNELLEVEGHQMVGNQDYGYGQNGASVEDEITETENKQNGRKNGMQKGEPKVDGWEVIGNNNENKQHSENGEKAEITTKTQEPVAPSKDPNRPRYTKAELQEILFERNQLKEEVFFLKDELAMYKPQNLLDEDEGKSPVRSPKSNRKQTKREDSGISKIFSIFTTRK